MIKTILHYAFFLACDLGLHQAFAAVFLPQRRLFDLAGGIPGHGVEENLLGPLVPGHIQAELIDLRLGAFHAILDLDDGDRNFAQSCVGQTDDGHILVDDFQGSTSSGKVWYHDGGCIRYGTSFGRGNGNCYGSRRSSQPATTISFCEIPYYFNRWRNELFFWTS